MPTTVSSEAPPVVYDGVERELNEDAVWKRIQQNTFTRWANEHLKIVGLRIGDLGHDLSDGLLLIQLIQILSNKKLGKHNVKPGLRAQKLENVAMALRFLEQDGIKKLVNIDSAAIVDNNLKLILALIWKLILHYSISNSIYDQTQRLKEINTKENGNLKETPKQKLLGWIQDKIPVNHVRNFTSDWRDGRALGALVDAVAPGLCSDWMDWEPENGLQNTTEAMDRAETWLGVPKLIEPQEFISPEVDEQSMMTYLSQYPHAKLRPNAPLQPWPSSSLVHAHGPGLDSSELAVDRPTFFAVQVFEQPTHGKLTVRIKHISGELTDAVNILTLADRNEYLVNYTPQRAGDHEIFVYYSGRAIPHSPFGVTVEGNSLTVRTSGDGLKTGAQLGEKATFDVEIEAATPVDCEVVILDPTGDRDTVKVTTREIQPGLYRCEYVPQVSGLHSINIFGDGKPIPGSPFGVPVKPAKVPVSVRAFGRGLQPEGVRAGDDASFYVLTDNEQDGELLDIFINDPDGSKVPLTSSSKLQPTKRFYSYKPNSVGRHVVNVNCNGFPVVGSPFEVNVGPKSSSRIRAYGPGLEGGMVNFPCHFTVETNGETGSLGFSIEGPSKAQINCRDNGDGSAEVSYLPPKPGEYAVHILCDNENIPDSPFIAQVLPFVEGIQPDAVVCYGPGLESTGVATGWPTEFTVDASLAGPAQTNVWIVDRDLDNLDVKVNHLGNQIYSCQYIPTKATRYDIIVSHAGVAAPGSPFRVTTQDVGDPSKINIYGPGVEHGVKSLNPTYFVIDCKQAGAGEVEVLLSDEKGSKVDIDVLENSDGTFMVKYTAPHPGTYQLRVVFAGTEIPGSPIRVNVLPHLDVGGIRVEGLDSNVFVGASSRFYVDCRSVIGDEDDSCKLACVLTTPSKSRIKCPIKRLPNGVFCVSYVPEEEGVHWLDLSYDNIPISRYQVLAQCGIDPTRCKVNGDGLVHGYVGFPCKFTVETQGAGPGIVSVVIEGPSEATLESTENEDGSRSVHYVPSLPGDYNVYVRFADIEIPGSPFQVHISYPVDADKVSAYGPGLDSRNCRANVPLHFHVDASRSGFAPLNVMVLSENKSQKLPLPEIRERDNNMYDVKYIPPEEGSYCVIHITYGGEEIPNSPYRMLVLPTVEPEKVRVMYNEEVVSLGEIPASLPYTFTIDSREAGYANLDVAVVGPDGMICPVEVVDRGDGIYDVSLVPEDIGAYEVVIRYGGEEIPPSPHRIVAGLAGDASKCVLSEGFRQTACVNEEYCLTVDASRAGVGSVTCRCLPSASSTVHVINNNNGTFSIFYILRNFETYSILISFGGQLIPQGELKLEAVSPDDYDPTIIHSLRYEEGCDSGGPIFVPLELWNVLIPETPGDLSVEVVMPSKKSSRPTVRHSSDGSVMIKYHPTEIGLHEMHIKHNDEHIQGSPLQFYVSDMRAGYATAYGQGLVYGSVDCPSTFTVTADEKRRGGLTVNIEGPGRADIKCHDNHDGSCTVTWVPPMPGTYRIHVKCAEYEIQGSPFTAKVVGDMNRKAHMTVGSVSELKLEIAETDPRDLTASITGPSGSEAPCLVRKLDEEHLGVSFAPGEIGEHLVYVRKNGNLLPRAPFRIMISESDIANPNMVKVYGPGIGEALANQFNEFTIDSQGAGHGNLDILIEGLSKCEIQCHKKENGLMKVIYRPTKPGLYTIAVKFADHDVPGAPFPVPCHDIGADTMREHVQQLRSGASAVTRGAPCELCLKIPGTNADDLTAKLASPSGTIRDVEVVDSGDHQYVVRFIPREVGLHTISVMHKDQLIPGSPFQFTVGPLQSGGAQKVRAAGLGLLAGEVGKPQTFNVYTREAGPGNLSVTVEGPSKAKIDFQDHKDENCYVTYNVTKPGIYMISIKFEEAHIPGSPFKVCIVPPVGDAPKLEVLPVSSSTVPLNKPVTLTVLTNGGKGQLDAKVYAPSGVVEDCFITPSDDGESYAVIFVPKEPGNHYIHLKLNGIPINNSPFRVRVGDYDEIASDWDGQTASLIEQVTCSGRGLHTANVGQPNVFTVDCSKAAGKFHELVFVAVMTPNGPSDSVHVRHMGGGKYEVEYLVREAGPCFVYVKVNDENAPGSPFPVDVA